CPSCGAALRRDQTWDWAPVARLSNLADCGYFCDTLSQHGIESRLQEIDEFSALIGMWEPVFVLQVPREDAARATELINGQLEADPSMDQQPANEHQHDLESSDVGNPWSVPGDRGWPDETGTDAGTPIWKSVALVLVAGGLAYGAGRVSGQREAHPTPPSNRDMLWQALSRPGETFVSEGPPGARKLRLRYDATTDRIQMDEDIDGDGRYDRRRTFDRGRLVSGR
ncbi:MAG: hypothetical protein MI757_21740, partial [Pirellulales bacterium]|nr:hypothetical protein [Pirellulales bacterium]